MKFFLQKILNFLNKHTTVNPSSKIENKKTGTLLFLGFFKQQYGFIKKLKKCILACLYFS